MENDNQEKKIIPITNDSILVGKGSFGSVYLLPNGEVYKETTIVHIDKKDNFIINENNLKEIIFYKFLLTKITSYTKHKLFPHLQYIPSTIIVPYRIITNENHCEIHMKNAGIPLHKIKYKSY